MDILLQHLVNGLTMGSVYALMALGFSLIYATGRLVNFAHSEVYMLGAYAAYAVVAALGPAVLPASASGSLGSGAALLAASGPAALLAAGALGWFTERIVFRPLRGAAMFIPVMSSLGLAIAVENLALLAFGADFKNFPRLWPAAGLRFGGVSMTYVQLGILAVALLLMALLDGFLRGTRLGRAMRAVAQDPAAARLMGIDVDRVLSLVFVAATVLGGVAGFAVAVYYGTVHFHMGFLTGIKGFTAAIFGGFGNVRGAILGGLLLGIFEAFGSAYVAAQWKDAIALVLLIAVIMLKPSGLLGREVPERL